MPACAVAPTSTLSTWSERRILLRRTAAEHTRCCSYEIAPLLIRPVGIPQTSVQCSLYESNSHSIIVPGVGATIRRVVANVYLDHRGEPLPFEIPSLIVTVT